MTTSSWNLAPPPGFKGLREDVPLRIYVQILPHWRQAGATYFVTFRLDDALPASKIHELQVLREEWERQSSAPLTSETQEKIAGKMTEQLEDWLDQGFGSCVLKDPDVSEKVVTRMHSGNGDCYELGCYVVMPNHVHAVIRPLVPGDHDLEDVMKIWKGGSAREINQHLKRRGTLWQRESYDRIIRDEEHLWSVIQYIGRNPAKAKLSAGTARLWINPEWAALGWDFVAHS